MKLYDYHDAEYILDTLVTAEDVLIWVYSILEHHEVLNREMDRYIALLYT